MKRKGSVVALAAVVALSLLTLGLLRPEKMSPSEFQQNLDSLADSSLGNGNPVLIEEQASILAQELSLNTQEQQEFIDQLTNWYAISQDVDVILIYNPGGFGGGAMHIDPEWPSVLHGIQGYLRENWGLTSDIVEHTRAEYSTLGFIAAVRDIRNEYRAAAPVLAAKIAFLSKYNPDLIIIVAGRSFGAVFSNEVMRLLPTASHVFSIQAGRTPGYTSSSPTDDRTLVIEDNGEQPDSWRDGDLWAIMQANLGHLPASSPPEEGSMQILDWYLVMPGHAYTWELLGVRTEICAFLDSQFTS